MSQQTAFILSDMQLPGAYVRLFVQSCSPQSTQQSAPSQCCVLPPQALIDSLDRDLGYAITHDADWDVADAVNYDEVKAAIQEKLESLRDTPNRYA